MSLTFRRFTGTEVADVVDELAHLRIRVFRDWPYLYDGDLGYERRYLQSYTHRDALVVAALDGNHIVGAAAGTPLIAHNDDLADAFAGSKLDPDRVFYCAESVLLPDWRGQGAGHVFFDHRETHARAAGFRHAAFCAVLRPDDHPERPKNHRPLDPFWRARGYAPLPGVIAHFKWRDLGKAVETDKPLQFWMRDL